MFRILIACSELASASRRVAFVAPEGIPAEPRAPDRREREMESANDRFGSTAEMSPNIIFLPWIILGIR